MKDQHNSDKTSTYLQHLDANNLYEGVIIQKLSTCSFSWQKKLDNFTHEGINDLIKKVKLGCILEFDVEHPKKLHKKYNELLSLANKMKIKKVEEIVSNHWEKRRIYFTKKI